MLRAITAVRAVPIQPAARALSLRTFAGRVELPTGGRTARLYSCKPSLRCPERSQPIRRSFGTTYATSLPATSQQHSKSQTAPALRSANKSNGDEQGGSRSRSRSPLRSFLTFLSWVPVPLVLLMVGGSVGSIRGASMSPTLNPTLSDKDVVFLNRYAARTFQYDVGDVVMLTSPIDPNMIICKRILAMPGDAVSIRRPGAASNVDDAQPRQLRKTIRIPPSHVWVEGDRSSLDAAIASTNNAGPALTRTSRDSREYGPIPMGLITDRVDLILWPPSRWGRLPQRPGFDSASSQKARKARQQIQRIGTPGQGQAHPDDSFLTPFMEWEWTTDQTARQGMAGHAQHVAHLTQLQPSDTQYERQRQPAAPTNECKEEREERRIERRKSMTQYWNSLSRGGQLGDDAEAYEAGEGQ